jgi:alkanesulfonate monooxygenase SsuD/methylene tetrahydromethanopterin reductase-like flavin-dependent oxidoreductase (luciferase family)
MTKGPSWPLAPVTSTFIVSSADALQHLAEAGFDGFCFSLVAYNDELPYFLQEVLPRLERLGLRQQPR